ncbi:hypothetical protein NHQ30_003506 [Ciborinia camelliae]|nr:hypothetical protein NHQ30_003506 [Ciborinia camelliae]
MNVAAQQFDPPGWSELIFTYACMLARTMGIHHAQLFSHDTSTDETLERAKVLRSLYSRDKSLCMTRGSVSWLPSYDCEIVSQLNAGMERDAPYPARCQLAIVQEEVYRFTHGISRSRRSSKINLGSTSKVAKTVNSIEQRLNQYVQDFGILKSGAAHYKYPSRAIITLEFLATRILALQHSYEPRHIEQVRWDAKVSCALLLIAYGSQDVQLIENFNSLTSNMNSSSGANGATTPITETNSIPFTSVLDAFSVPAFFILLKEAMQPKNDIQGPTNSELGLLRNVSACYSSSTERMQSNSYHRRLAWIFDQLLTVLDLLKYPQHPHSSSVQPPTLLAPVAQMSSSPHIPPLQSQVLDFFNITNSPKGSLSGFPFSPAPENTSFSWDNWSFAPSSLPGPNTPYISADGTIASSDLLSQILRGTPPCFPDTSSSERSMTWTGAEPEQSTSRKRARTEENTDVLAEHNLRNMMSETLVSPEMTFDF